MAATRSYRQSRFGYTKTEIRNGNTKEPAANSFWSSQGYSMWGRKGEKNAQSATGSRTVYQGELRHQEAAEGAAEEAQGESAETSVAQENPWEDWMFRFPANQGVQNTTLQERIQALEQMRRQTFDYLMQLLFGKNTKSSQDLSFLNTGSSSSAGSTQTMRQTSYFVYQEDETTSFSAKGTAVTADGRSIDFDIGLTMSRSFTQAAASYVDFNQPVLCDPLVINLNNNAATVTDQKFFFDLDGDGEEEEISRLNAGSGYLALDKNGDGVINDGTELFGTASGNGFADLAQYDEDGNGWIDEADAIFSKLKVWVMDENGKSKLLDLKEAGVGAMYLGYQDTDFSQKDSHNNTNAVIRKTGLFLYENGNSGTMQQLDLAT